MMDFLVKVRSSVTSHTALCTESHYSRSDWNLPTVKMVVSVKARSPAMGTGSGKSFHKLMVEV